MTLCEFPGCERFPHAAGVHERWDAQHEKMIPLADQRTRSQVRRDIAERARRERAERIARDVYAQGRSQRVERAENEVLAMLEAAALQALTETENAR